MHDSKNKLILVVMAFAVGFLFSIPIAQAADCVPMGASKADCGASDPGPLLPFSESLGYTGL